MLQRAELTVSAEVVFSEHFLLSSPMARTHRATTALATLVRRVTQTDKLIGNLLPSAASLSQKPVVEDTCSTVLVMTTGMDLPLRVARLDS